MVDQQNLGPNIWVKKIVSGNKIWATKMLVENKNWVNKKAYPALAGVWQQPKWKTIKINENLGWIKKMWSNFFSWGVAIQPTQL